MSEDGDQRPPGGDLRVKLPGGCWEVEGVRFGLTAVDLGGVMILNNDGRRRRLLLGLTVLLEERLGEDDSHTEKPEPDDRG